MHVAHLSPLSPTLCTILVSCTLLCSPCAYISILCLFYPHSHPFPLPLHSTSLPPISFPILPMLPKAATAIAETKGTVVRDALLVLLEGLRSKIHFQGKVKELTWNFTDSLLKDLHTVGQVPSPYFSIQVRLIVCHVTRDVIMGMHCSGTVVKATTSSWLPFSLVPSSTPQHTHTHTPCMTLGVLIHTSCTKAVPLLPSLPVE